MKRQKNKTTKQMRVSMEMFMFYERRKLKQEIIKQTKKYL